MKPGRVSRWVRKARFAVELPADGARNVQGGAQLLVTST
jgi:hypothetical protein